VNEAPDIADDFDSTVIEPIQTPNDDFDRLLDEMTPETFPEEVDFGPPVGAEIW
jgi:antitoxin MazE